MLALPCGCEPKHQRLTAPKLLKFGESLQLTGSINQVKPGFGPTPHVAGRSSPFFFGTWRPFVELRPIQALPTGNGEACSTGVTDRVA